MEFNCHVEVDGNISGNASDSQHCSIKIGEPTANISDINIGCCYLVDSKVNLTSLQDGDQRRHITPATDPLRVHVVVIHIAAIHIDIEATPTIHMDLITTMIQGG